MVRPRPLSSALLAGLAGLALLVSCGQYGGVHTRAASTSQDPLALSSPNGENAPPSVTIKTTVVVIKTVRGGNGPAVPPPRTRGFIPGVGPNPFLLCPVQGTGAFADDFGAPRFSGGFHFHAGNDILAALGTPIVAPFDGVATATPNFLGGNAVTVAGDQGYVYNAHLASYGQLGSVRAGTVIGYVGDTGDAMGGPTHDHFEWHPTVIPVNLHISPYGLRQVGTAIDPYPYLLQVCSRTL